MNKMTQLIRTSFLTSPPFYSLSFCHSNPFKSHNTTLSVMYWILVISVSIQGASSLVKFHFESFQFVESKVYAFCGSVHENSLFLLCLQLCLTCIYLTFSRFPDVISDSNYFLKHDPSPKDWCHISNSPPSYRVPRESYFISGKGSKS